MNPRFFSTPVGNDLPADFEVVWNGTHDKALSQYWQAQAQGKPAHPGFGQPLRASLDDDESTRDCDRVLRYLVANRHAAHTSRSVSDALGIDAKSTSVWLRRFKLRGLLDSERTIPRTVLGGRPCDVYRVRPLPTP